MRFRGPGTHPDLKMGSVMSTPGNGIGRTSTGGGSGFLPPPMILGMVVPRPAFVTLGELPQHPATRNNSRRNSRRNSARRRGPPCDLHSCVRTGGGRPPPRFNESSPDRKWRCSQSQLQVTLQQSRLLTRSKKFCDPLSFVKLPLDFSKSSLA